MQKGYRTVNLEDGLPTADQAVRRLTFELSCAKSEHLTAIKLIHGFGSSGTGGRIRVKVREYLGALKRRGQIAFFITGEDFSIFSDDTRTALYACPALRDDRDLDRHNNGITIVILKKKGL